jgi:peptide/nickel transport system substrate-binding protein
MVAEVPMYHMVGYSRVGPDVDFTPNISSNSELQVAHVKLK